MPASVNSYAFRVPGEPVAKERPRTVRAGCFGSRTFTPRKTKNYENKVAIYALKTGVKPLDGNLHLNIRVCTRNKRADLSNIVKAVEDGLNGIAYRDDVQICCLSAERQRFPHEDAHVYVEVFRCACHNEGDAKP